MSTPSTGRLRPTSACCPNSVSALGRAFDVCLGAPDPLVDSHFHLLATGHFWQPDCEYKERRQIGPGDSRHARRTDEHPD